MWFGSHWMWKAVELPGSVVVRRAPGFRARCVARRATAPCRAIITVLVALLPGLMVRTALLAPHARVFLEMQPAQREQAVQPNRRVALSGGLIAGVFGASEDAEALKRGAATVPAVGGGTARLSAAIVDSEAATVLDNIKWPAAWPFKDRDFRRLDETSDGEFYEDPRFVRHVDDPALAALTSYYKAIFPRDVPFAALDICSSWVSHYPVTPRPARFAITGMNEAELQRNDLATEFKVRDLNRDPRLPFGDGEFDLVTNTVSVDYLTHPQDVYREVHRVLKPGGLATISFSDRYFFTKVIARWSSEDDAGRAEIAANYLHFAGNFVNITVADISPSPGQSDPMFVVSGVKA